MRALHYTQQEFAAFDHEAQRRSFNEESGYTTTYGREFAFPRTGFFFFVGEPPAPVGGRTVVMPVYLSIQNPLDLTQPLSPEDASRIISFLQSKIDRPTQPGQWGARVRGDRIGGLRNARRNGLLPEQLWTLLNDNTYTSRGALWDDLLAMLGKDGLIFEGNSSGTCLLEAYRGPGDGKAYRIAVALRPEQIKSATGNSGRFDPASSDLCDTIKPEGPEP